MERSKPKVLLSHVKKGLPWKKGWGEQDLFNLSNSRTYRKGAPQVPRILKSASSFNFATQQTMYFSLILRAESGICYYFILTLLSASLF